MKQQKLQLVSFFIFFSVLTLGVILMWWPFLVILSFAAILALIFYPLHKKLLAKVKLESLSAFMTLLIILLIVLIPLTFLGTLIFNELTDFYNNVVANGSDFSPKKFADNFPASVQPYMFNFFNELNQRATELLNAAFSSASTLVSNVAGFVLALLLFFISIYYLLKDGSKALGVIRELFPLSKEKESLIFNKLHLAVNGVIKGSFLVALVQGSLVFVGFVIFGVPEALLWGALAVLSSLVPYIGVGLVMIPAVGFLVFTGHVGSAIGLAIWGILLVAQIDNIIRAKLVGSAAHIHPLLVLLSVLGGIQVFGYLGILFGPIITAMFLAFLDVYRKGLRASLEK